MTDFYGAVEAGGTKFNCAVGTADGRWLTETRIETTTPEETLARTADFFKAQETPVRALGIGSFGPLDLDPESQNFGRITSTPKPGWENADIRGALQQALSIPVALDTDVNAAALGEYTWGAGKGVEVLLYFTIGTGVGGGALIDGRPVHGLVHPEMGHIRMPATSTGFVGACPYHGDCFEGLASGPALEAQFGRPAAEFPEDHAIWAFESEVIAAALHTFVCVFSPQKIILGGGVMNQRQLFPMIRRRLKDSLAGYVRSAVIENTLDTYIVPPTLDPYAGLAGALVLAMRAGI
jgi:fructokinase